MVGQIFYTELFVCIYNRPYHILLETVFQSGIWSTYNSRLVKFRTVDPVGHLIKSVKIWKWSHVGRRPMMNDDGRLVFSTSDSSLSSTLRNVHLISTLNSGVKAWVRDTEWIELKPGGICTWIRVKWSQKTSAPHTKIRGICRRGGDLDRLYDRLAEDNYYESRNNAPERRWSIMIKSQKIPIKTIWGICHRDDDSLRWVRSMKIRTIVHFSFAVWITRGRSILPPQKAPCSRSASIHRVVPSLDINNKSATDKIAQADEKRLALVLPRPR